MREHFALFLNKIQIGKISLDRRPILFLLSVLNCCATKKENLILGGIYELP
jgi:hypothetical protein